MKKCTRCNNVIDWDKPFCPLCGGSVTDAPNFPKAEPGAPAVVEKISFPQREPASVPPPPAIFPPVPSPGQAAVPPLAPPAPPLAPAAPPMVPPFAQVQAPVPAVPPVSPPTVRVPVPPVQAQTPPPPPVPMPPAVPKPVAAPPLPRAVPPVPPAPQAGLFSQIHQTPGISVPPAPPLADAISQIHHAAAVPAPPSPPSPPQSGGFFSQIHKPSATPYRPAHAAEPSEEPLIAFPKSGAPSPSGANAEPHDRHSAPPPRSRVTFQDLTDRNDGSEAALGNALEALLKTGPPVDFAPPPPATPPPFFIPAADEEEASLPFAVEPFGGDSPEKDVLPPNLAEIMGINSLADLSNNAGETVPKTAPQTPLKPQVPPPPARDVIPDLPEDKPNVRPLGDDNDFLKMFPGVGG